MTTRTVLMTTALLLVGGCCTKTVPPASSIAPLETLIREHNNNAVKLPYLRASAEYDITYVNELGVPLPWRSYGYIFYARGEDRLGPHDFALVAKEAGNDIFRLGTSTVDNEYYFWIAMGSNTFGAVGRLDLAGAPGVGPIAIDPTQLLAALGVTEWPDARVGLPAVAMTLSHLPDQEIPCEQTPAYVLTHVARQPVSRKILFRRETYLPWDADPNTLRRPYMVKILDEQGRRMMTAHLADYRPVDTSTLEVPPKNPPLMPADIRVKFAPPSAVGRKGGYVSSMRIRLSDLVTPDLLYSEVTRKRLPASFPADKLIVIDRALRQGSRP